MTAYNTLRDANRARADIWGKGTIDLNWRLNELAGEVGEVCNMLKKIERERLGEPGSRITLDDLGGELADVMICLDLTLMKLEEVFQVSLDTIPHEWETTIPHHMRALNVPQEGANAWGIGLFLVAGSFISWQVPHMADEGNLTVMPSLRDRIHEAKRWSVAIEQWVHKINDVFCPKPMHIYVQDTFNAKSKQVGIDVFLDLDLIWSRQKAGE